MKALTFILFCFLFVDAFTQETNDVKRNTIYFELLGQGIYDSFTFDRLYNTDKKVRTSFSAGLTFNPDPKEFAIGTPISYNWIFGQKKHHLELGIGLTAMYVRRGKINVHEYLIDENSEVIQIHDFTGHHNDFYLYPTPKIGYRYQKQNGGFFWRATFTPPVAGISSIGGIQGYQNFTDIRQTTTFTDNINFETFISPWIGISFGWTLLK